VAALVAVLAKVIPTAKVYTAKAMPADQTQLLPVLMQEQVEAEQVELVYLLLAVHILAEMAVQD
jgi:hypothetical protein